MTFKGSSPYQVSTFGLRRVKNAAFQACASSGLYRDTAPEAAYAVLGGVPGGDMEAGGHGSIT
ncbi:hypothetical protein ACFWJM_25190 [Streptomyces sp. NPDC127077]|uniref:hypothetical protein n=1 Tax=Streptomyces sp. NPDC127077 TaxID=3347131 RepID=UPI0036499B3E